MLKSLLQQKSIYGLLDSTQLKKNLKKKNKRKRKKNEGKIKKILLH